MTKSRSLKVFACVSLAALAAGVLPGAAFASASASRNYNSPSSYSAPTSWGGLYGGIHLGMAWGSFSGGSATVAGPSGNSNSAMGGLQLGYNYQMDRIVLGGEADYSLMSLNARGPAGKLDENWMSTARARAGYSFDKWLPYATVGLALTNADSETTGSAVNNTHIGFSAGAGVDYAVDRDLWARVEYLYADVPNESDTVSGTRFNGGSANNVIRIGANYRFR